MNWHRKRRRKVPQPPVQSMADIGLIVLVFVMMATTQAADRGILVKLPPYACNEGWGCFYFKNNRLNIYVNEEDELMVRNERVALSELTEKVRRFITNPQKEAQYARTPRHAIVSLQCHRGTSYERYIHTYNAVKRAYNEIWDDFSWLSYGLKYEDLSPLQQQEVRDLFPFVVSEVEPVPVFSEEI